MSMNMNMKPQLKTWRAKQAVAILAVDNIKLSNFGYSVLQRNENGLISYEQAKEEVLNRAKAKVLALKSVKNIVEWTLKIIITLQAIALTTTLTAMQTVF